MKLFAKLMLVLLVLAVLAPFTILKNNQGQTLMSFSDIGLPDFKLPSVPELPSADSLIPSGSGSGSMDKFYKWYDNQGELQFTTEPPPTGIEYTVKEFDPNTNVIQAVKPTTQEPVEQALQTGKPVDVSSPEGLENAYSKESIEKLFEDTKNIEKLLNDRMQKQNAAIN